MKPFKRLANVLRHEHESGRSPLPGCYCVTQTGVRAPWDLPTLQLTRSRESHGTQKSNGRAPASAVWLEWMGTYGRPPYR